MAAPTAPIGTKWWRVTPGDTLRSLWLVLFPVLLLANSPADAARILTPDIDLNCSQPDSILACSYRLLTAPGTPKISIRSGNRNLEAGSPQAYPYADAITAVLFLVDTSDPGRQPVIRSNVRQIGQMLQTAGQHHRFGLANFDKELIVNVPVGGTADAINSAARTLKAVGMTTELYRNVLRAIDTLARVNADRKLIVLMSDGQAEDKAYFHEDVVRSALRHGIVINSLGFPRSVTLSVALQTLRRLSEETGGIYLETGIDYELPPAFLQSPFANVDKGGRFVVDLVPLAGTSPIPASLTIRFETGAGWLETGVPVTISAPAVVPPVSTSPAPAPTPPAVPVQTVTPPVTAAVPAQGTLFDTLLWYGVPVALVILSLLTLTTLLLLYRRQSRPATPPAPVIPMTDRPLAYLVRQDESGKRFPINSATCRIGRSRDNEMTIEDSSVSRRHAEIRRTFDGQFVLYDRDSTNGVFVNDQKITRHRLTEGDIIEIGDIFLRFTQKPADYHLSESTAVVKTRAP